MGYVWTRRITQLAELGMNYLVSRTHSWRIWSVYKIKKVNETKTDTTRGPDWLTKKQMHHGVSSDLLELQFRLGAKPL